MSTVKASAVLIITLAVLGCVSMPGAIKTAQSEFDGATEITMEPAWICKEASLSGCAFKLGLQRRSTMPGDQIILIAMVQGVFYFSEPSLLLNIDGEILKLVSIDSMTDISSTEGVYLPPAYSPKVILPGFYLPPSNWSVKQYLMDKALLQKMISAQKVAVRINSSKTYVEGTFSQDRPTTARPAFREFFSIAFEGEAAESNAPVKKSRPDEKEKAKGVIGL
ncbi:MAG: hypothetical protein AB1805_07380 [Nitrospirota bacterium]